MPPKFVTRSLSAIETSAPSTATTDKGKGIYFPPHKKITPTKAKGIVIGAVTLSMPVVEEEEDEPIMGESKPTLSAADIPIEGQKRGRAVGSCCKASIDTIVEEQAAQVASFIYE